MVVEVRVIPTSSPDNSGLAEWEAFLEAHPLGQFQQSTRWAKAKAADGWEARLFTFRNAEELTGGFLILIKLTRWGRVGFVNKGPVLEEESASHIQLALDAVRRVVVEERLRALVLQPPDLSQISPNSLRAAGFSSWSVPGVLDATAWASLEGGPEAIRARMGRTAQKECHQALAKGVRIFEGDASHLGLFFDLMAHTCQRQGVDPNPPSVKTLQAVWNSFGSRVHLLFAQIEAQTVAGLLILCFGNRSTFWKKGWNEKFPEAHPNTLLNYEAMVRSHAWGCNFVDFTGMDRTLAERWGASDKSVHADLNKTRHAFNIRLGAVPRILPPARLYTPSRFGRIWAGIAIRARFLRNALKMNR